MLGGRMKIYPMSNKELAQIKKGLEEYLYHTETHRQIALDLIAEIKRMRREQKAWRKKHLGVWEKKS